MSNSIKSLFAQNLRLLRRSRNLSIHQLARAAHVAEATLEAWEDPKSQASPTLRDVEALATELREPFVALVWGELEMPHLSANERLLIERLRARGPKCLEGLLTLLEPDIH